MKPALQLRLSQQLTMTPQLQQAIRLLLLPVAELNTQLEQLLAENVMLDVEESEEGNVEGSVELDAPPPDPSQGGTPDDETPSDNWDDNDTDSAAVAEAASDGESDSLLWNETSGGGSNNWDGEDGRPEPSDSSNETLQAHLLWQIETEHFEPREVLMAQALVDAINDSGYLTEPLPVILETLAGSGSFTLEELEQTLAKVQALDPAGVGARDLGECIRIQLRQLSDTVPGRDLALAITMDSLDLVAERQLSMLRRRLEVSEEDLDIAVALIRNCHPKPGLAVQPVSRDYIVPDVFVRKRHGRWSVDVNRSITPRLKVNQAYADMVRGDSDHATLRNQLQEARWLVRSLEIRNDTLLKVAVCIVERQADFLEHGEESMRPMVLRDVAELVEMHESTISRVTANKYMHTPRGVFEFRHFFSSQVTGDDGNEQSSTAIRAKIRKLISQEDPAKPLSDSQVADLLAKQGVQVARRTVAKYREAMHIEPSSERRRRPQR
ncbi:MAG: RNA polymerase factor sigma-54 [Gammaproteobacteria bacterium]|nr:RNA polymerase factor sigma-54 [Gammaproteobacteria bacterium]MDH5275023.1 RNA polymerase factor sigma-54 [Gammaproteobacteria bacterium]